MIDFVIVISLLNQRRKNCFNFSFLFLTPAPFFPQLSGPHRLRAYIFSIYIYHFEKFMWPLHLIRRSLHLHFNWKKKHSHNLLVFWSRPYIYVFGKLVTLAVCSILWWSPCDLDLWPIGIHYSLFSREKTCHLTL